MIANPKPEEMFAGMNPDIQHFTRAIVRRLVDITKGRLVEYFKYRGKRYMLISEFVDHRVPGGRYKFFILTPDPEYGNVVWSKGKVPFTSGDKLYKAIQEVLDADGNLPEPWIPESRHWRDAGNDWGPHQS